MKLPKKGSELYMVFESPVHTTGKKPQQNWTEPQSGSSMVAVAKNSYIIQNQQKSVQTGCNCNQSIYGILSINILYTIYYIYFT